MSKYLAVFNVTWENMLVYRLNFALWRVRSVLQLLVIYFIWWTVFQTNEKIFGYTESSILTYVLVTAVIRAMITSSRVMDVSSHINEGSIVNFLVRPLNFVAFYFTRDLSDKLLNIFFVIFEVTLLIMLLKPQFILQKDISTLGLFILATLLGLILFFCLSFILGLLAFWLENAWGPYFLLFVLFEGLGGTLFPIDVLPKEIAQVLLLTPFPYFVYFPAKLYLGSLSSTEIMWGFIALCFWIVSLWIILKKVLDLGFKHYSAVGH